MSKSFIALKEGVKRFKERYAIGDQPLMYTLAEQGQHPSTMVITCSDSRVDPALILQADPGDLFVVRNVANIVPSYRDPSTPCATRAALEYGICHLKVDHLVILGHSQCGGIKARLSEAPLNHAEFITPWVSTLDKPQEHQAPDVFAKQALLQSYQRCLDFPWIKERVDQNRLSIHLWFFEISSGTVEAVDKDQ